MNKNRFTTIYIMRHGETEYNVQNIMQGHSDSHLTPLGEEQAKLAAKTFARVHFDQILSSDLLRAKRTAEIIALERQIEVKTSQALRERSFGKFDGYPLKNFQDSLAEILSRYEKITNEEIAHLEIDPTIETVDHSVWRYITFIREIAVGYAGKTVLIVSHGAIMRYFLIHIGFATYDTLVPASIENTGYFVVESDGVDFFVKETQGIHKTQ